MMDRVLNMKGSKSALGENVRTIVYALGIALILRTLLFQPFHIPSESMVPTLATGDYIFASKFSYGYSRHSLPLSPPIFDGRILGGQPDRGDVVVFKYPRDNRTDYIKRVVGLPGDRIQMIDGVLNINGQPVGHEFVKSLNTTDDFGNRRATQIYRETFPNGDTHIIFDQRKGGPADNTRVFFVPENHYFMMGDNRDDSRDSRYFDAVPAENLVGKAQIIFFSVNENFRLLRPWTWFNFRLGRFFHGVRANAEEL
ncbi:signal peptidase I [Euryhalocaulis sp.]|uniref:signal peptidase I n=1 Tax=Euryhalocaulis sp. TaxID=2744307 RepID=UPI00257D3483|nr:signal peptidase I [Euryhalocaulis sp.]